MKIRLALTITIGKDPTPASEERTVDLVGTHHDIPEATYDVGFQPGGETRR